MVTNCFWLLKEILNFTSSKIKDPVLFSDSNRQDIPLHLDKSQLPSRRTDVNFSMYSSVVGKELICGKDSRFEIWGTMGYLQVRGRNRRLPGHTVIDLGTGLNSSRGASKSRSSKSTEKQPDDSVGNKYFGLFYGDDVRTQLISYQTHSCFLFLVSCDIILYPIPIHIHLR